MGTVEDISWDSGKDPATSMPSLVLVKGDGYEGPEFPGFGGPGIIPIFPITRQFEYKGAPCSRTQFPTSIRHHSPQKPRTYAETGGFKCEPKGALPRTCVCSDLALSGILFRECV